MKDSGTAVLDQKIDPVVLEGLLHSEEINVWFTPYFVVRQVRQTVRAQQVRRGVFRGRWEPLKVDWHLDRIEIVVEGLPGFKNPVWYQTNTRMIPKDDYLIVEIDFEDWPS